MQNPTEGTLARGTALRDAAVASGHVTAAEFGANVHPLDMVGDGPGGA